MSLDFGRIIGQLLMKLMLDMHVSTHFEPNPLCLIQNHDCMMLGFSFGRIWGGFEFLDSINEICD